MKSGFKNLLKKRFSGEELNSILNFLERGFSKNGQIVIASVFINALEHNKSVEEVLVECEKEWKRNWQYAHSDIKGDPDAPGIGWQNRISLENIYAALNIPSPLKEKEPEIPLNSLVVTTHNSVYRLGKEEESGKRAISRDNQSLDFTECKVLLLKKGFSMELECFDCNHAHWYTTMVLSIEPASV